MPEAIRVDKTLLIASGSHGKFLSRLDLDVQGGAVKVSTMGGVMIDAAHVTTADVAASNGVIHIIDTVLMPKA